VTWINEYCCYSSGEVNSAYTIKRWYIAMTFDMSARCKGILFFFLVLPYGFFFFFFVTDFFFVLIILLSKPRSIRWCKSCQKTKVKHFFRNGNTNLLSYIYVYTITNISQVHPINQYIISHSMSERRKEKYFFHFCSWGAFHEPGKE